jgi:hypothetical protein
MGPITEYNKWTCSFCSFALNLIVDIIEVFAWYKRLGYCF